MIIKFIDKINDADLRLRKNTNSIKFKEKRMKCVFIKSLLAAGLSLAVLSSCSLEGDNFRLQNEEKVTVETDETRGLLKEYGSDKTQFISGRFLPDTDRTCILTEGASGVSIFDKTDNLEQLKRVLHNNNKTRLGDAWYYDSDIDEIYGPGDFDGDGTDEFLITSRWGIGIIGVKGSMYNYDYWVRFGAPNNTMFNYWRLNTASDRILRIADFDGLPGDEVLIRSDWGIAILKYQNKSFYSIVCQEFDRNSEFLQFGDFNGDGKEDMVVRSSWGTMLYDYNGTGTLRCYFGRQKGSDMGSGLRMEGDYEYSHTGDFDGDGKDEMVVFTGYKTFTIFHFTGSGNGSFYGNHTTYHDLGSHNVFYELIGVGDYNGDGRDELYVYYPYPYKYGSSLDIFGIYKVGYNSCEYQKIYETLMPKDLDFRVDKWNNDSTDMLIMINNEGISLRGLELRETRGISFHLPL